MVPLSALFKRIEIEGYWFVLTVKGRKLSRNVAHNTCWYKNYCAY